LNLHKPQVEFINLKLIYSLSVSTPYKSNINQFTIIHPLIVAKSIGLPPFSFGPGSRYYLIESRGLGNSRPLFGFEELFKATNGFSSQILL